MITLWVVYVGGLAPLHVTIPALSWPLSRHKRSHLNGNSQGLKQETFAGLSQLEICTMYRDKYSNTKLLYT